MNSHSNCPDGDGRGGDIAQIRLPRQLETDGSAVWIRRVLAERMTKLWSGGDIQVPVVSLNGALKKVLRDACLRRRVRCGFDEISARLETERRGLAKIGPQPETADAGRISRLLLVANDGADRLYRHIEQVLKTNRSRLLVCLIDADSLTLGNAITGKESRIKAAMVEHKDAVSEALKAAAS